MDAADLGEEEAAVVTWSPVAHAANGSAGAGGDAGADAGTADVEVDEVKFF